MEDIHRLSRLKGAEIREAKAVLAYEATRLCHGRQEADQARAASKQLFGGDGSSGAAEAVPVYTVQRAELKSGVPAYILFERAGLCKSRGEARRLIAQGGGYLNDQKLAAYDQIISMDDMDDAALLLRAGKKRYKKIITE